ncbi:MAG: acyl-CoA desaturase [Cyanobacteria bacterium REEB67]|nr:acyl-CoA desaturase [Cyanobacteria bacterium REEB67]
MDLSHWFTWTQAGYFAAWFMGTMLYLGMGITLGYHRLLTHKSLKVPRPVMYFWVAGGYLALMGAPISWVAVHRLHHQKSDQPGEDPHTPRDGIEHALYKWMFTMHERQPSEEVRKQVADLIDDPVLKLFGIDHSAKQAQLCLWINIAVRVAILFAFGPVAFIANLLASITVFWSPQFVNTFCHLEDHGYRNFEVRDDSRNVPWVGLLAMGEGWHNNHHAMPRSARHGIRWFEFDITWCTIWLMEKMGLAKDIVRPSMQPVSAVAAARAAASKARGDGAELVKAAETAISHAREEGAEFVKAAETAISNAAANVMSTTSEAKAP